MKTKAYKKLFESLHDNGEIPDELYSLLLEKIAADGKMNMRIYEMYLRELERRRLFSVDGAPFDTKNSAKTDGSYVYLHRKNPFWYIGHAVTSTIFKFLGWLGSGLAYGMWRFPRKYKKKFRGIGACVTVSNHVGYVDAVLTRRALGMRKQYIIAAPHNCKRNIGGAILRSATVVPLPSTLHGVKPFEAALEYLKDKKAAVHFYAEKSMWIRYKKPRPYHDGAFFYADKLGVPVVPMLYCFKESRGLRKLFGLAKATVRVADPIYPDASLSPMRRRADLAQRAANAVKALYEEFYGVPLEYEPPLEFEISEGTADKANVTADKTDEAAADFTVNDAACGDDAKSTDNSDA